MTLPEYFSFSTYNYELPNELIAQYPISPRDQSRLLIVDRKTGNISEAPFKHLLDILQPQDELVFNNTKVIPARLIGKKKTGGTIEIFLHKRLDDTVWETLAKPGKKAPAGTVITFGPDFTCEILDTLADGRKKVKFNYSGTFEAVLGRYAQIPLPHYMQRPAEQKDFESYQTVYAEVPGALAAPTAGLHFSEEMLVEIDNKNVKRTTLTLHVGLGTFKPVKVEDIRDHIMHEELFCISQETAERLNNRGVETQICVGTTTCRALESAVSQNGLIIPGNHSTDIFIYPGYQFKYVKSLLTNFHLPKSTLLMLVCAFGGYELMMEAYRKAVKDRFRFFSYGDAMLIL